MGKINVGRVIIGGLLAGLIINISEMILHFAVVGESYQMVMEEFGLAPPDAAIAGYVVLGFLLGIAIVWVYAAIRNRFGPGPQTALLAGFIVWALAYLYPTVGVSFIGMFPTGLLVIGVVWGLIEVLIAAFAGAWMYRET